MNDWMKETDKLLKFRIKQDREYISIMDEMYKKHLEKNMDNEKKTNDICQMIHAK